MNVTTLEGQEETLRPRLITDEELQKEYNYLLAEQTTNALLKKGLITQGEYDLIMRRNTESFHPLIESIPY